MAGGLPMVVSGERVWVIVEYSDTYVEEGAVERPVRSFVPSTWRRRWRRRSVAAW